MSLLIPSKPLFQKIKGEPPLKVLPVDDDGECLDGGLRAWLVVLGVRCLLSRRESYWRLVKWYACSSSSRQIATADIAFLQLHVNQEHPDAPLLEHTRELIAKLES